MFKLFKWARCSLTRLKLWPFLLLDSAIIVERILRQFQCCSDVCIVVEMPLFVTYVVFVVCSRSVECSVKLFAGLCPWQVFLWGKAWLDQRASESSGSGVFSPALVYSCRVVSNSMEWFCSCSLSHYSILNL